MTKPHTKLSLVGIVSAAHLPKDEKHLLDWLHSGYSGDMKFLSRDPHKRCDPREVLPSCKSVIVAAMRFDDMPPAQNQKTCAAPQHESPSTADAAKYLQHEDYHAVMMRELEALVDKLREQYPKAEFKCYVDTGPVLEKAWAVRAGLGFIGKNTLFISPKFGSQLALGVVLTSCDMLCADGQSPCHSSGFGLESRVREQALRFRGDDKACRNDNANGDDNAGCASCRACIDACPEKALVAPYKLDARRCRSYKFFIEKKKGGCDICQNVCPFNKTNREAV